MVRASVQVQVCFLAKIRDFVAKLLLVQLMVVSGTVKGHGSVLIEGLPDATIVVCHAVNVVRR
jgi:hypothetical protein